MGTERSEKEIAAQADISVDLREVMVKHGLSDDLIHGVFFNELHLKLMETMDEQGYHID